MIELVLLGRTHGYEALRDAIEKTVAIGCMDVSAVVLLLNGRGELCPAVRESLPYLKTGRAVWRCKPERHELR